jgi:hypothetical protein
MREASIAALDPTWEIVTRAQRTGNALAMAAAPKSWSGLRVGLLANGKTNGEEILDELLDALRAQPGISLGETLRICKSNESTPPTREQMRRLVEETDVVLTAIGD